MTIDPWRVADDPAADEAVMSLLRAARPSSPAGPVPGEAQVLAEFRAAGHDLERPLMHRTRTRARVLIATAATAGMLTTAGAAAAATGTLPGAAQQTARDMLATLGVTVPGPDSHANGHADTRGNSDAARTSADQTSADQTSADQTSTDQTSIGRATTDQATPSAQPSSDGKGAEISSLAKTTTATGADKGAEISTLASGGKSQAGQHGTPSEPGSQGTTHQPAEPGSKGTTHQPAEPGSQGTAHQSGAGATGAATSASHRP
jgi:hypothetical protein